MNDTNWRPMCMLNEKELKTIQQFDLENNYPHHFWLDMVDYDWLDRIVSQLYLSICTAEYSESY